MKIKIYYFLFLKNNVILKMNINNNIINIQRNDDYKIRELTKIKEIINKLFWEISNFILRLKSYSGLKLSNSQNDIILGYKKNIIFLGKKGYSLIIDFFDFDPPEDDFYNNYDISNISFSNSYISLNRCQSLFNSFVNNNQSHHESQHESHHESHYVSSYEFHNESHHEKLSQKSNPGNEFEIKCFKCIKNNPIYLCHTCNMLVCKKCLKELHKNSKNKHEVINFLENEDKNITLFLNSLSAIFKNLLIKCNFLLKNNIELKQAKDMCPAKIDYIKKFKNLPYLDKITCFDDEINFLKNLEKEIKGLKHNDEIFQNSFHFSKLDTKLIDLGKNIFSEDQNSNDSKENNINFQFDLDNEDFSIHNE